MKKSEISCAAALFPTFKIYLKTNTIKKMKNLHIRHKYKLQIVLSAFCPCFFSSIMCVLFNASATRLESDSDIDFTHCGFDVDVATVVLTLYAFNC